MSNVRQHLANALQGLTVVASETHVEIEWLRLRVAEVEFASPEEESAYCTADLKLASQIEALIQAGSPSTPKDDLLYTNHDWWPNRTRSVSLYKQGLAAVPLDALQDLLVGQYSNWRIFANVVESPESQLEVGCMFLTQDRAVVQRSIHELVQRVA
jgi:hypothetical protein